LTFPQGVKSASEDVMTKAIDEMRSNISGDPFPMAVEAVKK
jgi:hypothetical protein